MIEKTCAVDHCAYEFHQRPGKIAGAYTGTMKMGCEECQERIVKLNMLSSFKIDMLDYMRFAVPIVRRVSNERVTRMYSTNIVAKKRICNRVTLQYHNSYRQCNFVIREKISNDAHRKTRVNRLSLMKAT